METFELIVLAIVAPVVVWMTLRGERHLTRISAWALAVTTLTQVVRSLLALYAPPDPLTEGVLVLRALVLAGWGVCCGSLAGWLYRNRDRATHSS